MSRKPNVEGIKELRQKLLMFQALEKEVTQRRSNLETATELLKFSEKRMSEVGGEVKKLLESMDTEVKGNFGWESRLHTLLSEFQRQEREEAKERVENARIQGENKVRNEEFEKREKAAAIGSSATGANPFSNPDVNGPIISQMRRDIHLLGEILREFEILQGFGQPPAREALARLRIRFGESVEPMPEDPRDEEIKRLETIIANQQQEIDIFKAKAKGEWPNSNSDLVNRIKKAEKALDFYGKPENYLPREINKRMEQPAAFEDEGKIARDAILSPKPEGWNDKENALEFYADPENWNFSKKPGSLLLTPPAHSDEGAIARIALGRQTHRDIKNMLGLLRKEQSIEAVSE